MGVRVEVIVRYGSNEVLTSALANSGYESEKPEVLIPIALARKLGIKLEGVSSERYRTVGTEVSTLVLGDIEVCLVVNHKVSKCVKARAVTVFNEYEVLLSDALIEELGIEIVRPRSGEWRLRGEDILRKSAKPQYWIS